LTDRAHAQAYVAADVIVGVRFSSELPRPEKLQLFHVPGAGYDAVDLGAIPDSAVVCNCFGHEQAIAEYVMAALLEQHVPLAEADRHLRRGDWTYTAGSPERVHGELAEKTIGLLGFGHIGKAIASRAKASRKFTSPIVAGAHITAARSLAFLCMTWANSGARQTSSWCPCHRIPKQHM
jgi:phosphoglycerate dehydrogenase-like enzyme